MGHRGGDGATFCTVNGRGASGIEKGGENQRNKLGDTRKTG